MSDQFIDPDRDIIYANRSPPLERIEPNFASTETPPPILSVDSSSESSDEECDGLNRPKRGKGPIQRSQGDFVLIRSLGPQYPEVANQASKHVLACDSSPEASAADCDHRSNNSSMLSVENYRREPPSADEAKDLATAAYAQAQEIEAAINHHDRSYPFSDVVLKPILTDRVDAVSPKTNGVHVKGDKYEQTILSPAPEFFSNRRQLNTLPPPLSSVPQEQKIDDNDSIATSPALAKFAIKSSEADPEATLPAMQRSPSRSISASSPDQKQTLPSLETALGPIMEPSPAHFSAQSPHLSRPASSRMNQFGPSPTSYSQSSPNSGMSPPGVPGHQHNFWRPGTRDGSISTPSEYTSAPASNSTAPSSILTQSPATSYPTPAATVSDQSRLNSQDDSMDIIPQQLGMQPHGILPTFKCTVDGCSAPPFQTQYLLNSHMNVHSESRPHFCPVKDCPRGPGGQGFKRKNEMIR